MVATRVGERAGHWGDYWAVEKVVLTADQRAGHWGDYWAVPRVDHSDEQLVATRVGQKAGQWGDC